MKCVCSVFTQCAYFPDAAHAVVEVNDLSAHVGENLTPDGNQRISHLLSRSPTPIPAVQKDSFNDSLSLRCVALRRGVPVKIVGLTGARTSGIDGIQPNSATDIFLCMDLPLDISAQALLRKHIAVADDIWMRLIPVQCCFIVT